MAAVPRVYSFTNTPISSLVAYEIAQLPIQPKIPQVVLLLNDRKKLDRFLDNDSKLVIQNREGHNFHHTQFMASHCTPVCSTGELAQMDNVIASGKHSKSLKYCLEKLKNSLTSSSNVLLLNPPFGSIDFLCRDIWSDESRPNIFIGITPISDTFYAFEPEEFHYRLKRNNIPMQISSIPRIYSDYGHEKEVEEMKSIKDNDLMKLVQSAAHNQNGAFALDLLFYPYGQLLLMRLERLVITSCIQPLALLNDCKSKGELLESAKALNLSYKLIREQVAILMSSHPLLNRIPHHSIALDPDRLYEQVIRNLKESGKGCMNRVECPNISELTGYFTRLAKINRLNCKWNETITTLVRSKTELEKHRNLDYLRML